MKNKIIDENQLAAIAERARREGKRIVATGGCFDILHPGHILYLAQAKAQGDMLCVFLNTDESVKRLKGNNRPIVDQNGRAIVLSGLESVDYICLFGDATPCRLVEKIKPDVFVKGGDYRGQAIPEMDAVKTYGGKVEYLSLNEGFSTTNIIEEILRKGG